MKVGPRDFVITHIDPGGNPAGREKLVREGGGGRWAVFGPVDDRHRRAMLQGWGAEELPAGAKTLRISGTAQSWNWAPRRGDALVGRVGSDQGSWARLDVIGWLWWDWGRTLELVVMVVAEAPRDPRYHRRGVA